MKNVALARTTEQIDVSWDESNEYEAITFEGFSRK